MLCGCSRPSQPGPSPTHATVERAPSTRPARSSAPAAVPAPTSPAAGKASTGLEDDNLKTEEREANPYSETVTLKLSVTPQVKALVMWGAKQIARLSPGSMETEIARPRGSGPLDLEIRAEGFMPYHTRLYADRNDKVNVRLYRTEEAPGLLGYKPSAEDKRAVPETRK